MITFLCLSCGGLLKVQERLAGRIGQCSHCGHLMQVPNFSTSGHPVRFQQTSSLVLLSSLAAVGLLGIGGAAGFWLGRQGNAAGPALPAEARAVAPSEPPVAVAEWQDVAPSARQGAIEVALHGAEVRYVAILRQYVTPKETPESTPLVVEESEDLWKHKELVLSLRIRNLGTQPLPYTHPGREETRLLDNLGNQFRQTYENEIRIKGQVSQAVIGPGQTVDDLLVFSCSYVGKGDQLLLELPAHPFGGQPGERLKLKMEQKAIVR